LQHHTDGAPDWAALAESACIAGYKAPGRSGSWPHAATAKKKPAEIPAGFDILVSG